MLYKSKTGAPPKFIDEDLWNSRIPSLKDFQESNSRSVLVALDIENSSRTINGRKKPCADVNEVGIAVLLPNNERFRSYECVHQLHHEGWADTYTIQILERRKIYRQTLVGQIIKSEPKDVASTIESILSKYEGPLVLVGFDLHQEFKWITEKCSTILSYFAAWLDVQDFAWQRHHEFAPMTATHGKPGLTRVLKSMGLNDRHWTKKGHYAINDALSSLLVLSGLASNPTLLSVMCPKPNADRQFVRRFPYLQFKLPKNHGFSMVRIGSINGGKLPPWSPDRVSGHFSAYADLRAVGLNWRKANGEILGAARFWQLAFRNIESAEKFVADVNASTLDGIKLSVVRTDLPQPPTRREVTLIESSSSGELEVS
ncbi:unnamed protein product [Periconia digitata]|uniref:Uncharacterized protein n=1 Tax=Periconia digitata TaxID=1303443 RepID=A0A9W4U6G3_9PLEO|nr:unnamed protein product [Periconia digitata]